MHEAHVVVARRFEAKRLVAHVAHKRLCAVAVAGVKTRDARKLAPKSTQKKNRPTAPAVHAFDVIFHATLVLELLSAIRTFVFPDAFASRHCTGEKKEETKIEKTKKTKQNEKTNKTNQE